MKTDGDIFAPILLLKLIIWGSEIFAKFSTLFPLDSDEILSDVHGTLDSIVQLASELLSPKSQLVSNFHYSANI